MATATPAPVRFEKTDIQRGVLIVAGLAAVSLPFLALPLRAAGQGWAFAIGCLMLPLIVSLALPGPLLLKPVLAAGFYYLLARLVEFQDQPITLILAALLQLLLVPGLLWFVPGYWRRCGRERAATLLLFIVLLGGQGWRQAVTVTAATAAGREDWHLVSPCYPGSDLHRAGCRHAYQARDDYVFRSLITTLPGENEPRLIVDLAGDFYLLRIDRWANWLQSRPLRQRIYPGPTEQTAIAPDGGRLLVTDYLLLPPGLGPGSLNRIVQAREIIDLTTGESIAFQHAVPDSYQRLAQDQIDAQNSGRYSAAQQRNSDGVLVFSETVRGADPNYRAVAAGGAGYAVARFDNSVLIWRTAPPELTPLANSLPPLYPGDGQPILGISMPAEEPWWELQPLAPLDDFCLRFSSDGRWLALRSKRGHVALYDVAARQLVRTYPNQACPSFGQDNATLIFHEVPDETESGYHIRLVDISSDTTYYTLALPEDLVLVSLSLERTGRYLAVMADYHGTFMAPPYPWTMIFDLAGK